MHWLLVRLLRRQGGRLDAAAIRRVLDAHLAEEPMAVEARYLLSRGLGAVGPGLLSPFLTEADLMRRMLPRRDLRSG